VARRSDNSIVAWGDNTYGQCNVPTLPTGLSYVEVAGGGRHTVARRSDGNAVAWGFNDQGACNVPALPTGLTYVRVAASIRGTVARRSDGSIVAWGDNSYDQRYIPAIPSGLTYVEVAAAGAHTVVRLGAESSYVTFGTGCTGSLPPTKLVPLDTPYIGTTLQIHVDHLPVNAAFFITGWSNTTSSHGPLPISMGVFGMPGCSGRVSKDLIAFVVGTGGFADYRLPIPSNPMLVGVHFYQQALVLDPAAGNAFGGVMSDAAAGVVGN